MKGLQVLIDRIGARPAAARLMDGRLDDLLVDPPADRARPGAVYRATVGRAMKGQGARIFTLPDGTAFVRQGGGLREGAAVLVQITGYAEPGKAAPATTKILFKSRYCIATPDNPGINLSRAIRDEEKRVALRAAAAQAVIPEGMGLILRSAAAGAEPEELVADIAATCDLAATVAADTAGPPELLLDGPDPAALAWREWSDAGAADVVTEAGCFATHGVTEALAELAAPREALPGGAALHVEPTRALVAVDVDTGADTSPAAGHKANLAAARALPRALRLRGLGGQIAVDFAPIAKRGRAELEQVLHAAFRADPVETTPLGWTPLGHYELTRKRERLPLTEAGLALPSL